MVSLLETLSRGSGMSQRDLQTLVATAPARYKTYRIPKRSGGYREIAHPAFELKIVQRILVEEFLSKLPVHSSATAYKVGTSIRLNAERHAHNRPILKYDFKNFFPSITEQAWLAYCYEHRIFDRADAVRSARLMFRRARGSQVLRLSVGAPSSPILSNVLMYKFDDIVFRETSNHKITYTRYADDMTFSAERTWNLREVDAIIRKAIRLSGINNLSINSDKTVLATTKYRRQVTGLVLTLDNRVSVGRDRKRAIRAAIHHFILGKLSPNQQVKLAGLLAFAKDVEPEFFTRMERVYGKEVISEIHAAFRLYKSREDRQVT